MTATRTWDFMRSYSAFPVMLNRLSLPGLTRQSILFARRWMRGSSPRMTVESSGSIRAESAVASATILVTRSAHAARRSMKLPRRRLLQVALAAGLIAVLPRIAQAQTYPARPVPLIVPFGSAGATDIVARLIGQWLSQRLGQSFVIENRPGAGGNIGT